MIRGVATVHKKTERGLYVRQCETKEAERHVSLARVRTTYVAQFTEAKDFRISVCDRAYTVIVKCSVKTISNEIRRRIMHFRRKMPLVFT